MRVDRFLFMVLKNSYEEKVQRPAEKNKSSTMMPA